MSEQFNFKWCQKIQRYKIKDPFLRMVAEKYESEIPWEKIVRDENTLNTYLLDNMLPELRERVTYNDEVNIPKKSFFVSYNNINPEEQIELMDYASNDDNFRQAMVCLDDRCLYGDEECEYAWENYTQEQWDENCLEDAAFQLQFVINRYKSKAYFVWVDLLSEMYPTNPAFQLLVLRPVFTQFGFASRRLISPPEKGIVKWLFQRIKQLKLSPKENIGKEYNYRVVNGLDGKLTNGWQHIPYGVSNISKLTSAANGGGWCISGHQMASIYLKESEFYILRINNKPKIAIRRLIDSEKIIEIQGVQNSPSREFFSDISFFLRTMSFELANNSEGHHYFYLWAGMLPDYDRYVSLELNEHEKDTNWWQLRTQRWPFAWQYVPEEIKEICRPESTLLLTNVFYLGLPLEIRKESGIELTINDYEYIIRKNPSMYKTIGIQDENILINACVEGTLVRMFSNDITLKEFGDLPAEIRKEERILEQLKKEVPKSFEKQVSRRGSNRKDRAQGKQMEEVIGFAENEPPEITALRALEMIVKNESSDFSDLIFSKEIRLHPEFKEIREKAWIKAVEANPTFYFAFPSDLINRRIWEPQTDVKNQKMLEKWITLIESRPWKLESDKVPKAVKYHEALLRAYLKGWSAIIVKNPSRIWKKINSFQRAYCSYAALRNFYLFSQLSDSLKNNMKRFSASSDRMKAIPTYQLAMLYAASRNGTLSKFLQSKKISPIFPRIQNQGDNDAQRQLIKHYFYSNQTAANAILREQPTFNSFFFNDLDPSTTFQRRIRNGDRLLLEINEREDRFSIGEEVEGFEKLDSSGTEAKGLYGMVEGETVIILGNNVKIIEILKF